MTFYQYSGGQILSEDDMEKAVKNVTRILYDVLPEGLRTIEVMESVLEHAKEEIHGYEVIKPERKFKDEKEL